MKIIILGPPGTGKGTQAKIIAEKFGLKHLSTGAVFRSEFEKKTKLGIEAQKYWGFGNLVPDVVTLSLVKTNLPKDNFILDGFPRNLYQAKELDKIIDLDYILNIEVDKKIIIERLLKRAKIEGREDDTPEIIENRFKVYEKETKPILRYYNGRLLNIDGHGSPEDVYKRVVKVFGDKISGTSNKLKVLKK